MRHEPIIAFELRENGASFRPGKHDRKFGWTANALDVNEFEFSIQHLLVEKKQGTEGLILGRGSDFRLDGKMSEEQGDFGFPQFVWMAFPVENDVSTNPVYVSLFGTEAVMLDPQVPANAIE